MANKYHIKLIRESVSKWNDFSEKHNVRANLRGANLRKLSLKGINLHKADLRGTDLRGADLSDANLSSSETGLQKRFAFLWLFVLSVVSFTTGLLVRYASELSISSFAEQGIVSPIMGIFTLISLLLFYVSWIVYGIEFSFIGFIIGLVCCVTLFIFSVFFVLLSALLSGFSVNSFEEAFSNSEQILLAVVGMASAVISFLFSPACSVLLVSARIIFGWIGFGVYSVFLLLCSSFILKISWYDVFSIALSIVVSLLIILVSYFAIREEERHVGLLLYAKRLACFKGTRFNKAYLKDTSFREAQVKSSNFTSSQMLGTSFQESTGLAFSICQNTIFENSIVRDLAVLGKRKFYDYENQNLQGINLADLDLSDISFKGSNFSEARLQKTDLRNSDLSETQMIKAQLESANLTGAYIESWNIDRETNVDDVRCDYIYVLSNSTKERRPSEGTFEPGEFSILTKKIFPTIELVFEDGIGWKKLLFRLQEISQKYGEDHIEIQSIEKKNFNQFVVRIEISESGNRLAIEREIREFHRQETESLRAEHSKEMEKKEVELKGYKRENENMQKMIEKGSERTVIHNDNRNANIGNFANEVSDDGSQEFHQHQSD